VDHISINTKRIISAGAAVLAAQHESHQAHSDQALAHLVHALDCTAALPQPRALRAAAPLLGVLHARLIGGTAMSGDCWAVLAAAVMRICTTAYVRRKQLGTYFRLTNHANKRTARAGESQALAPNARSAANKATVDEWVTVMSQARALLRYATAGWTRLLSEAPGLGQSQDTVCRCHQLHAGKGLLEGRDCLG
jgi:hypothetical protein